MVNLLEFSGVEQPKWWGYAPSLIDPSSWINFGPDPFAPWTPTTEAEWQKWFAQQTAGQRDGRKSAQYSFVRLQGDWKQFRRDTIPKHPIVPPDSLRPGWIICPDGFRSTGSRNPMIHIVEDGRLIAVMGSFAGVPAKDRVVPHPIFQPELPSEATRSVLMELLGEFVLQLPTRMVPIRVIKVGKNWELDLDACRWLELPISGRLVVPMNPPQNELVEWLNNEMYSRHSLIDRANRLWLTRRIAGRVSRWTTGLKERRWQGNLPPRLQAAVELVSHFQLQASDDFPRFLTEHSGARALCLNVERMSEEKKIFWRGEVGAVAYEYPFLDAHLAQAKGRELVSRRLQSRRDEAVFSLSSFPRERLELRRIIEG